MNRPKNEVKQADTLQSSMPSLPRFRKTLRAAPTAAKMSKVICHCRTLSISEGPDTVKKTSLLTLMVKNHVHNFTWTYKMEQISDLTGHGRNYH